MHRKKAACAAVIGQTLAVSVCAATLKSQHIRRFSADGCHSSAWAPETVLDGNRERGWATAQRDAGAGWGRHWIMLESVVPLRVR